MTKRRLTVGGQALKLAKERLEAYNNSDNRQVGVTKTIEDLYPAAIQFVLDCRKAVW